MFLLQTLDSADVDMITSENFDNLISHLVWPITVVLILLIFKKNLAHIFKRLGSFRADATGISMDFIDKEIEAVETLVDSKPQVMSKSATGINSEAKIKSPHYQLLSIRAGLRDIIVEKAEQSEIATQGKSSLELRDDLIDKGSLTPRNAHVFSVLINLTSTAGPDITKEQVTRIKRLYKNLSL